MYPELHLNCKVVYAENDSLLGGGVLYSTAAMYPLTGVGSKQGTAKCYEICIRLNYWSAVFCMSYWRCLKSCDFYHDLNELFRKSGK